MATTADVTGLWLWSFTCLLLGNPLHMLQELIAVAFVFCVTYSGEDMVCCLRK